MRCARTRTSIGAPFYVMEMVEGRTFWEGAMPGQTPAERGAVYRSMIATLAQLHNIDPAAVGLGDYGAPGNYFERQVARWTKQYRAAQTDDVPEVERLIGWLPATLPPQERVSIIHGDYRIDNIIFAPDRSEVSAVLDWELSTLGDPLADFAYLAMNWAMPAGAASGDAGRARSRGTRHPFARRGDRALLRRDRPRRRARSQLVLRLQSVPAGGHRPGHQETLPRRLGVQRARRGGGVARADAGDARLGICAPRRRTRLRRGERMSLFDLTGKVAIITGSSRGIGRAIAEEYAAQGARVVISSRRQEACEEVAAAINARHGEGTAVAIAASISSKPDLEALVARTRAAFGRIDVLVCNAASNPYYGSMNGIADEQFRKILDNNILSNHWLIQLVAARDGRAARRRDHRRLVDRRTAGIAHDRRLQCLQGSGLPAGAQLCGGDRRP